MMRYLFTLIASLWFSTFAMAQTVKLPESIRVDPGRLASIKIEWDGDDVRWATPTQLDIFREYDPDPKAIRLRIIGYTPGTYEFRAIACKGARLGEFTTCMIVVGVPTPQPPPGPAPPGPTPPVPPGPAPVPAPIQAEGLHVLILYESQELSKLPREQYNVLYATNQGSPREYLSRAATIDEDGKTRAWRIWDKDVNTSAESKTWQNAMIRAKATPGFRTPWIIISDGKTGYEGPLPANPQDTVVLLKKWGG